MRALRTLTAVLAGYGALIAGLWLAKDSAAYTPFAGSVVALVGALAAKSAVEHRSKKDESK